jgi:hypothetical protein
MKDFLKKIIFMPVKFLQFHPSKKKKNKNKNAYSKRAQIWGEGFSCDG